MSFEIAAAGGQRLLEVLSGVLSKKAICFAGFEVGLFHRISESMGGGRVLFKRGRFLTGGASATFSPLSEIVVDDSGEMV